MTNPSPSSTTNTSASSNPSRPKVALVLGSGGAKGIAHIGVFKVLHEAKIPIDLIVGCSMGALLGAFYAEGHPPEYILERSLKLIPRKSKLLGLPSPWRGLMGKGFFTTNRMYKTLSEELTSRTFEELKIPLQVVATDLEEGKLTTFSTGRLLEPLCASSAIPGLFQPVKIGDQLYVDGAVISELPIQVAKKSGGQLIIASNVKGWIDIKAKGKIGNVGIRSYYIMRHHFDKITEAHADVVIRPDLTGVMNAIFSNKKVIQEVYRRGKECTEKQLPTIQALLGNG